MNMGTHKTGYSHLLPLALIGLATCAVTAVAAHYIWKEWLLLAIALSVLYFSGVFRFFPWKTAYAKAFSIGVFVGMVIPVVEFIRGLG